MGEGSIKNKQDHASSSLMYKFLLLFIMTTVDMQNLVYKSMKETFGEIIADILDLVVKAAICPLRYICQHFPVIPLEKIKEGLLILLHHHFITWIYHGHTIYYKECHDTIISFMRSQQYIFTVREKYGKNVEQIIDTVLREGSATASQAIINAWIKITKHSNESTTIETLLQDFKFLVDNMYIQRCYEPKQNLKKSTDDSVDSELKFSFSVSHELIMSIKKETAIRKEKDELSIFPNNCPNLKHSDSNIYWRLNYDRFDVDLRDKLVQKYMSDIIDKRVGPIFDVMLKVAYKHCNYWDTFLGPITVAEIEEKKNFTNLVSFLTLMNRGRCEGFIDKLSSTGGGEYRINMTVVITKIAESIINCCVMTQFGPKTHRVYRTVRMEGMLEKSTIERMTMIGPQETNKAIASLLGEMYFLGREFRKGGSISALTGNAYILYHVDLPFVIRNKYIFMYKTMFNITVHLQKKQKKKQSLLEKGKRIDLLVDHYKITNSDLVKQTEDMITTEEREQIAEANASFNKYIANIVRCQTQAFLLKMFIKYDTLNKLEKVH